MQKLVKVTVAAPRRRLDLALPEDAVVAEVLPGLLARAGGELADVGLRHGGWVLRRFDGAALEHTRTLAGNRVRDGEVLRLVPRRQEWPELRYDDLVHAIATGAGRRQRWTSQYTRVAGLGFGAAVVLLGLVAVVNAGPDWGTASRWAFGQAVLLLVAGVVLARVVGDSVAGALAGLLSLPYAFAAGVASQDGGLSLTAPQLLVGCAVLTAFGLVGYVTVVDGAWLFAGAVTTGVFGLGWAWLGGRLPPEHVAALFVGVLLPLSPLLASLAIRLGKLPLPVLPRNTADLLRDEPQPDRDVVYRAVERTDSLLTGMLAGTSLIGAVGTVLLLSGDSTVAHVLGLLGSAGWLLRARLYPVVRQRVPLLVAGIAGPVAALLGGALTTGGSGLVAFGALLAALGIVYSQRSTSPYLRRMAEYAEILLILAVMPMACWVLGVYGWLRGLGG